MVVLRFFVSLFMAIFVPISNFISASSKAEAPVTYTEFETVEKKKRDYGAFAPGENDIFVDASAENGNGTQSSPFSNILSAKEKAKQLRSNGVDGKITVWISEGVYVFESTLVFDETDADNVVYRAMPDEQVSFSGAVTVDKWAEDTQNGVRVLTAEIPEGMKFDAVTKDGTTLPKTRYPETGYLTIETEDHSDALFTPENTPWEFTLADKSFIGNSSYNPSDIKNIEIQSCEFSIIGLMICII